VVCTFGVGVMSVANVEHVDVQVICVNYFIEDVIVLFGVELYASGYGYMGCCLFYDDLIVSMLVGGVFEWFKCFGCDAGGDVIEYVSKWYDFLFVDFIEVLQNGIIGVVVYGFLFSVFDISYWDFFCILFDCVYDIN